jgi:hypothetical protein
MEVLDAVAFSIPPLLLEGEKAAMVHSLEKALIFNSPVPLLWEER